MVNSPPGTHTIPSLPACLVSPCWPGLPGSQEQKRNINTPESKKELFVIYMIFRSEDNPQTDKYKVLKLRTVVHSQISPPHWPALLSPPEDSPWPARSGV